MTGRQTNGATESQTGHRQDAGRTARVLNKRHERMTDKQDGRLVSWTATDKTGRKDCNRQMGAEDR
jgi:hypothetical protein